MAEPGLGDDDGVAALSLAQFYLAAPSFFERTAYVALLLTIAKTYQISV